MAGEDPGAGGPYLAVVLVWLLVWILVWLLVWILVWILVWVQSFPSQKLFEGKRVQAVICKRTRTAQVLEPGRCKDGR